jgi:hypothetical protein
VLGGFGAVLDDGGIDEVVVVSDSVVVVVVPVVPDGSVVVEVVLDVSVSVDISSPSEAQAARDIVATANAATVRVRSMLFMEILCCTWGVHPAGTSCAGRNRAAVADHAPARSGRASDA